MDGLSGTVFLFSYALATCVLRRVQPLVAVGLRGRLLGRSGKLVACLLDDGALGVRVRCFRRVAWIFSSLYDLVLVLR